MKQLKLSIEPDDGIVNKKIKEEFSLKNATIYGGHNLFSDYLAVNGLDRLLEEEFAGMKAPWARYSMPIVCRTLIDGYALGLRNIYQFEGIESDPLISAKHACLSDGDQEEALILLKGVMKPKLRDKGSRALDSGKGTRIITRV